MYANNNIKQGRQKLDDITSLINSIYFKVYSFWHCFLFSIDFRDKDKNRELGERERKRERGRGREGVGGGREEGGGKGRGREREAATPICCSAY